MTIFKKISNFNKFLKIAPKKLKFNHYTVKCTVKKGRKQILENKAQVTKGEAELHRNEIPLQITFTFRGQGLYLSNWIVAISSSGYYLLLGRVYAILKFQACYFLIRFELTSSSQNQGFYSQQLQVTCRELSQQFLNPVKRTSF